jgi:hypothetical protein
MVPLGYYFHASPITSFQSHRELGCFRSISELAPEVARSRMSASDFHERRAVALVGAASTLVIEAVSSSLHVKRGKPAGSPPLARRSRCEVGRFRSNSGIVPNVGRSRTTRGRRRGRNSAIWQAKKSMLIPTERAFPWAD